MANTIDWDPTEPITVEDRYDQMADMRARCPVAWAGRHGGQWDFMRYDDVVRIAGDPVEFSNGRLSRYAKPMPPLEYDAPEHRDFRRLLAVFFTPKRLAVLEPRIRAAARDLLAPMIAAGKGDLAKGYSYPLPALGLCALLDIPASDWAQIKDWSEHTLLMDSDDPADREIATAGHNRIIAYAQEMIADRRANPRSPEEDLTAAVLSARMNGEPLDDDTMARTLRLLISAGHNSTTSGIGNAILHLAEDRAAQQRLRADEALIPTAVEEFLRFDTPVQEMPRIAVSDIEIGGRRIGAGDRVGLFWASANRDEKAFPDADKCLLDRKPNRHVAFGHGIHTCLGAPMARLEMRIAIEELLRATKRFEIAGPVERAAFHRMGVVSLPLRFGDKL